MGLDDLIDRLGDIPGARVGHGPRHPKKPDLTLAERIRAFTEAYPRLLQTDPAYVEFLEKYSGAMIEEPESPRIVDILGFSEASTDIEEMEGEIVDENGFLLFCQCVFHTIEGGRLTDTYEYDFAFDISGDRRQGVYLKVSTLSTQDRPYEWHSDGFLAWLYELTKLQGRYERPAFG